MSNTFSGAGLSWPSDEVTPHRSKIEMDAIQYLSIVSPSAASMLPRPHIGKKKESATNICNRLALLAKAPNSVQLRCPFCSLSPCTQGEREKTLLILHFVPAVWLSEE